MKTKKIKYVEYEKKPIEVEEVVIDRDYYNKKILEKALSDKKSIVIEIDELLISDVHNLPNGWTFTKLDWDVINEEDEEDYKQRLKDWKIK